MKHLLLFIFSCLLTVSAFSQQKFDTLTTYTWQTDAWQPDTRSISTYNSSCLTESLTTQEWLSESSVWRNATLTTYTYTTSDSVEQATTQLWDTTSGTWIDAFRLTYSYGTNGKVSQLLTELWDAGSSAWGNASLTIYSYNTNNFEDSVLTQSWDPASSAWVDASLTVYTYNADNTLNQMLIQFSLGVTWLDIARITYAYNADQTVNSTITEAFDLTTSTWYNAQRNAYTYNAAKMQLTDTTQTWNTSEWQDSTLTINTYNGNQLSNTLDQFWNGSEWVDDSQSNYTYNTDGTLAEVINQNWDGVMWLNDERFTLSYTTGCTLPVTLVDFTATLKGKIAQLHWTTVTEINTKDFVVQRSTDGINFENLGTVDAAGNSTQKISYQFTDAEVLSKGVSKMYYRLQMRDKDGSSAYSKIATVNITPNGKIFVVYPNPVKDQLITTSIASFNNAQIKITDQSGKLIYSQQVPGIQAGIQNKINVSNLGKGIYYLQIITGSDVQTEKFFKY